MILTYSTDFMPHLKAAPKTIVGGGMLVEGPIPYFDFVTLPPPPHSPINTDVFPCHTHTHPREHSKFSKNSETVYYSINKQIIILWLFDLTNKLHDAEKFLISFYVMCYQKLSCFIKHFCKQTCWIKFYLMACTLPWGCLCYIFLKKISFMR